MNKGFDVIPQDDENPKKKIGLCPDPVGCSEKDCKEEPAFAYWQKGEKQFKFCCLTHMLHVPSGQTIAEDEIEDYLKKRKRKIYHTHFKEYL